MPTQTLDQFFADNEDWLPFSDLIVSPPLPEELMKWFEDVSTEVLSRCMEATAGGIISRGAIYVRVRREDDGKVGTDKWATMLSLQAPPIGSTNDTFWGGRKHFSEAYGEEYANRVRGLLAKKGINLGPRDEYMPELARFQGDPEAVVPFGGGRSYIKRLCEKRGWACEGPASVKHREPESDPHADAIPMANDLIRKKACQMVKANPELKKKTKREIVEMVVERHGPSKIN